MCALLWFRPSVNWGVGPQIDILTEMDVALGALLGSIVDLLIFPKIIMKNIAYALQARCLGFFKTSSKTS